MREMRHTEASDFFNGWARCLQLEDHELGMSYVNDGPIIEVRCRVSSHPCSWVHASNKTWLLDRASR